MFAFPAQAISVFVADPAVIAEGVVFLRFTSLFWALFAGVLVIQGAFRGAGNTTEAMVLSFLSRWIFRVPVALVLAFTAVTVPFVGLTVSTLPSLDFGIRGIWIGLSFGYVASFVVAVAWFRLGTWTESVVDDGDQPEASPGRPTNTELDSEFFED
jgi:Na+-driven multidrug efflux pump